MKVDKDFMLKIATQIVTHEFALEILQSQKLFNILTDVFKDMDFLSSKNELSVTVSDNNIIIKNFIGCKELAGCQNSSIDQYLRSIQKIIEFTNKDLLNIDSNDIRRFLLSYEKTVCKTTVDNCRRNLNTFFQFMEDEGYILRNPCKRIQKIKEEIKHRRFYTDMEMESMRDCCNNAREKALIDLLLCTGLRVSEVSKIKISEIDWEDRKIVIHGKGNKDRIVPFTIRCKKHLQEYLLYNGLDINSMYLFSSERSKENKSMHKCSIQQIVKNVGKRAGLPNITVHCFRRWFASDLYRKGMDSTIIQEILGHTSFQTTQRHYLDKSTDKMQYSYNLLVS